MRNNPAGCDEAKAKPSVCATIRWCVLVAGLWIGTASLALADPPLLTNPPLSPDPLCVGESDAHDGYSHYQGVQ